MFLLLLYKWKVYLLMLINKWLWRFYEYINTVLHTWINLLCHRWLWRAVEAASYFESKTRKDFKNVERQERRHVILKLVQYFALFARAKILYGLLCSFLLVPESFVGPEGSCFIAFEWYVEKFIFTGMHYYFIWYKLYYFPIYHDVYKLM